MTRRLIGWRVRWEEWSWSFSETQANLNHSLRQLEEVKRAKVKRAQKGARS